MILANDFNPVGKVATCRGFARRGRVPERVWKLPEHRWTIPSTTGRALRVSKEMFRGAYQSFVASANHDPLLGELRPTPRCVSCAFASVGQ